MSEGEPLHARFCCLGRGPVLKDEWREERGGAEEGPELRDRSLPQHRATSLTALMASNGLVSGLERVTFRRERGGEDRTGRRRKRDEKGQLLQLRVSPLDSPSSYDVPSTQRAVSGQTRCWKVGGAREVLVSTRRKRGVDADVAGRSSRWRVRSAALDGGVYRGQQ